MRKTDIMTGLTHTLLIIIIYLNIISKNGGFVKW